MAQGNPHPELHPENLRPNIWPKGVSGNPKGSSNKLSIKSLVKKALEENPDERQKFVNHFVKTNRELAWQMLEGKPQATVNLGVDKEGIESLTEFFRGMGMKPIKPDDNGGQTSA